MQYYDCNHKVKKNLSSDELNNKINTKQALLYDYLVTIGKKDKGKSKETKKSLYYRKLENVSSI